MSAILELPRPRDAASGALSASALALDHPQHTSLDPARIVRDLATVLAPTLAWDGLAWKPPPGSDVEPLLLGRECACQCHYTLSAGGQPLGELSLSRRQPFTPESIAILEELLRGLLFPLRNALLNQAARRAVHAP